MRKLSAIMFTDIVGYTAIMGRDEKLAIQTVNNHESTLKANVPKFDGEIINFFGDGCLSIFPSVTSALECAWKLQGLFQGELNVPLRIGIHVGEILFQDNNIYGNGVNVASRIESLGQAGTIFFSEDVFQKIQNNDQFTSKPMGKFEFKNVERAMMIYALSNEGCTVPDAESLTGKLKNPKEKLVQKTLKSIAVLPFESNSQNPDQEFFIDGITDEIRSQLLSIHKLKVISRSSCMFFKNKKYSLSEIEESLNVSYALEGRIQIIGEHIKVSVELTDIKHNKQIWSLAPFVQKIENVFEFQNETALKVVSGLKLALSDAEKNKLNKLATEDKSAYAIFQKGITLIHKGVGRIEDLDEALACFKGAIKIDPFFTRAYIGISDTYLEYVFWGRKPSKLVLEDALEASQKALSLNPTSGEAYGSLGAINFFKFNKIAATRLLEQAISINPNYIEAYEKLAWIEVHSGNIEKALQYLSMAQALDPLSTRYLGTIGHVYYLDHQFDDGIRIMDDFLKKHPEDSWILWMKAFLYSGKGEYQKAIDVHLHRLPIEKNTNWMLAYDLGKIGEIEKSKAILDSHLEHRAEKHVPAYMISTMFMGLGDHENALKWLEIDYKEGGQGVFFWGLKSDPKFEVLMANNRFKHLINIIC